MHQDHRRNTAHKNKYNKRTLSSLTGPQRLNKMQQSLRNRKSSCDEPNIPHNSTRVLISGPRQSCKIEVPIDAADTKCFQTEYITSDELVSHLQQYLRDLLVLEEELEDTRIRLVSERDFFPKLCFRTFLATEESRDKVRTREDDEGKICDGLSELEATAESIFSFLCSYNASDIGMCS